VISVSVWSPARKRETVESGSPRVSSEKREGTVQIQESEFDQMPESMRAGKDEVVPTISMERVGGGPLRIQCLEIVEEKEN